MQNQKTQIVSIEISLPVKTPSEKKNFEKLGNFLVKNKIKINKFLEIYSG
jgi:CRISPR/Cas system-associated protein endoribonuclease Cas2